MPKLVFDEDRDLALAQPSALVKLAAAACLVGALIGGTGAIQMATIASRAIEPPIWGMVSIYLGIFVAPMLAFSGAKLFRLAPWSPIGAVVLASLGALAGLGQLGFMFRYNLVLALPLLGPGALAIAALASLLALRSAFAAIGARRRLSDEGIELGV